MSHGTWNEYGSKALGEHVGDIVADMLADRDLRLATLIEENEQLHRDLALAQLRIEQLEADRMDEAEYADVGVWA